MTTKRESILSAVATLLGSTTGVSGRVFRSRAIALRSEELPAVLVEPIQDTHEYPQIANVDSLLQFRVAVVARGAVPDQVADPIVQSAYALLMADRDLGGLAMDLYVVSTTFTLQEGDGDTGISDMIFAVKYRTQTTTLES